MDKVSGINALVGILRSQVTRNAERKSRSGGSTRSAGTQSKPKPSARELDSLIVNRINKLDVEEEGFQRKSVRIIVESILAWEFGDEIMADPEFDGLVNKVCGDIESSEQLSSLYKEYYSSSR